MSSASFVMDFAVASRIGVSGARRGRPFGRGEVSVSGPMASVTRFLVSVGTVLLPAGLSRCCDAGACIGTGAAKSSTAATSLQVRAVAAIRTLPVRKPRRSGRGGPPGTARQHRAGRAAAWLSRHGRGPPGVASPDGLSRPHVRRFADRRRALLRKKAHTRCHRVPPGGSLRTLVILPCDRPFSWYCSRRRGVHVRESPSFRSGRMSNDPHSPAHSERHQRRCPV